MECSNQLGFASLIGTFHLSLHENILTIALININYLYTIPCHAMPCHAMPCHAMPCHAMPCHAMPCHAMPCHAMPCHAMPCHAMPYHTIPSNHPSYYSLAHGQAHSSLVSIALPPQSGPPPFGLGLSHVLVLFITEPPQILSQILH